MQTNLFHKLKLLLWFPLVIFSIAGAMAQGATVKGRVTDESGAGLPGVTVLLKGTSTAIPTEVDGSYTFPLPDLNGTLVFSYIGFQTQEVAVNNRTTLDV